MLPRKIKLMDDIKERLLETSCQGKPYVAEAIARRWVEEIEIDK